MANNKITCVHITSEDVRLLEGRVSSGVILITRSAIVPKTSRFFHGGRLALMSELVTAIINSMNMNSFTSNQLHIVYDNGLEVEFFLDEKLHSKRQEKKTFSLSFGKKGKKDDESGGPSGGIITHKKSWGQYITDAEQGEMYTTTKIERDLVSFMIAEFQEHGYKVVSIEAPETAILYLRKFIPYSYDALNKLVIYANNQSQATLYQFTKDAVAGNKIIHFESGGAGTFAEQCVGMLQDEIRKAGIHNPHIFLIGDAFSNPDEYSEICEDFKEEGLFVIDTYSLWEDRGSPLNQLRVITPSQGVDIDMDGAFGICVCLLARTLESKPENLVEGFHPMFLGKKTKRMLASGLQTAATLFLIYNLVFAGIGAYEMLIAQQEYDSASDTTDAQLTIAESERNAVKSKVDSLSTIDSRYNAIFKFVYEHVSDNLNIASVDTADLIPQSSNASSAYTDPNAQATPPVSTVPPGGESNGNIQTPAQAGPVDVTGGETAAAYEMQTIVIRGYSRTSDGPMELYTSLTAAGLGEVTVVGIEQVPLPSRETLFAFELTVGSNEGVT